MAKGETKKTNQMLDDQRKAQTTAFTNFTNTNSQRSGEAYGRSNEVYDKLLSGYGGLADGTLAGAGGSGGGGGWALPSSYGEAKSSYQDFIKTGGIDPDKIRGAGQGAMEEISRTGGFDDATKARIAGDINAYRTLGQTGGVDAAGQARMRGGGVFDEFARTGGVSDAEARNLRARGNASAQAAFAASQADMNRARRIQGGGSSAMAGALSAKMARDRAGAVATNTRETELGLSDRVRSGRQWGGQGMAESEGALQGLMSSNRLAGMGGALGGEMGLADTVAKNRLSGAGAWNQSEMGIQELGQRGKMFGTSGLESVAGAEAANAASNASASSSNGRYNDAMRLEGLEGLSRLRGQTPGEVGAYDDNILQGLGTMGQLGNEQLGMRYNAPGNQGTDWGKIAGAAAGIAGGVMTGGASLAIPAIAGGLKGMGGGGGAGAGVNPNLYNKIRF